MPSYVDCRVIENKRPTWWSVPVEADQNVAAINEAKARLEGEGRVVSTHAIYPQTERPCHPVLPADAAPKRRGRPPKEAV